MGTTEDKIKEFKEREEKELVMGGEKQIQKQHDKGKLTARERLDLLFDQGSFRELDMFIRHRCIHFDMPETFIPGEGVVTGHGTVNGRLVYAYSQDFTSVAGTLDFSETPLPLE
jgi:acetyl-CoA carboxylase carboxyltransferase component